MLHTSLRWQFYFTKDTWSIAFVLDHNEIQIFYSRQLLCSAEVLLGISSKKIKLLTEQNSWMKCQGIECFKACNILGEMTGSIQYFRAWNACNIFGHAISLGMKCMGHATSWAMVCLRAWNVLGHAMSRGIQCLGACNVSGHAMSRGMECLRACIVSGHAMSQGMECLGACNVLGHAMSRGM